MSATRILPTNCIHIAVMGSVSHYGKKPILTRFDNIVDIGPHRHGEKPSERFIPSTVYAIRDGCRPLEFAAFDPLLSSIWAISWCVSDRCRSSPGSVTNR